MPELDQRAPQQDSALLPPGVEAPTQDHGAGSEFAPQAMPQGAMAWGDVDGRDARVDRLRGGLPPGQEAPQAPGDAPAEPRPALQRQNGIRGIGQGQAPAQAPAQAQAQAQAQALDAKAQTQADVASMPEKHEQVINFTVTFIERELSTPTDKLKPFADHNEKVKAEARKAALFTGKRAADREAKAQFGVLRAIAGMVNDAPSEAEAATKREGLFEPRFKAATEEAGNVVVEKAGQEAIADAIATHEAHNKEGFLGVQIGAGDADLTAATKGDLSQGALSGASEIDARGPSGANIFDKNVKAGNTESNADLGSKDVNVGGSADDWETLIADRNVYGIMMKGMSVFTGAQDDMAASAAAEAKEALTFGQTEGAGGALKAGLGGFNFDSKTGTLSANLAKWTLVPPYPPLAAFSTPISLAPGVGVALEAVVTVSVGAKGNLSVKREGYEDQLAERAKVGGLQGAHEERKARLEAAMAKLEQVNQALQAARDGGDAGAIEAAETAKTSAEAEKAEIDNAIIHKAEELRALSDGLMQSGESVWSLKGDLGVSAALGGEIFAGGFIGLPLVNVGAGIYGELSTNLKGNMALTGTASFGAGQKVPKWDGIKGDISAMARATAAIGAKVKYQFIFVSGDIYECTFADWTLGVLEYAGQMNTEPGLNFKTTKKEAHFGGLPPMEKELIKKGEEAEHYGDATGKKVGELAESATGTERGTAAVGLKSGEVEAAGAGVAQAALGVQGAEARKDQIGQETAATTQAKDAAAQEKSAAEAGQQSEGAKAAAEDDRSGKLGSVSEQTAGFKMGGMKDQAGQQEAYQANLAAQVPKDPNYMAPTEASIAKAKVPPKPQAAPSPLNKFKAAALTVGAQKKAVSDSFMHVVSKASAAGAEDAAAQARAHESRAQGYQAQAEALMQTILDKEAAIERLNADATAQDAEIEQAQAEVVAARERLAQEALSLDALIADLGTSMEDTRARSADLREKRVQSRTFTEKIWRNAKALFGADIARSDLNQALETAAEYEAIATTHKTKTDADVAPKVQAVEAKKADLAQQKQAAEAELARYEGGQDSQGATAIQNYKNHVEEIEEATSAIEDLEQKVQTVEGGTELEKAKAKVKELKSNKPGKDGDMAGWQAQLNSANDEVTAIEASRKALIDGFKAKIQAANVAKTRAKRARDNWRGGFFSRNSAIEGYRDRISKISELQAKIDAAEKELSGLKLVQVEAQELLAEAKALVAKANEYIEKADSADAVVAAAEQERRRAQVISDTAHAAV